LLGRIGSRTTVGSFGDLCNRFLDVADCSKRVLTATEDSATIEIDKTELLSSLRGYMWNFHEKLMQDPSGDVRQELVENALSFSEFLGQEKFGDLLLPLLLTLFNYRGLRVSILDVVVGIATFIGKKSFPYLLLPCLEVGLNDRRFEVVEKCLEAFTALTEMHVFDNKRLLSCGMGICPLVCHPSAWVRNGCINFFSFRRQSFGVTRLHGEAGESATTT